VAVQLPQPRRQTGAGAPLALRVRADGGAGGRVQVRPHHGHAGLPQQALQGDALQERDQVGDEIFVQDGRYPLVVVGVRRVLVRHQVYGREAGGRRPVAGVEDALGGGEGARVRALLEMGEGREEGL
jgi:hypothetical protein